MNVEIHLYPKVEYMDPDGRGIQLQFMQGVSEKWTAHAVEAVAASAYSTR